MRCSGLLADVNVQGHLPYLRRWLAALDLAEVLETLSLSLVTFHDLRLTPDLDDRALWTFCQQDGWVLLTENRNHDGPDSLQATLIDSWHEGHLPILMLANKRRFEAGGAYAERVARDVAELLFGIEQGQYVDQPRIFVPLQWS